MSLRALRKQVNELRAAMTRQDQRLRANKPSPDLSDGVERKLRDPLNWLQQHTQTKDPHWQEVNAGSPYRSFPDKPYFRPIIEALQREPVTFILKSRDLMLSWLVVGYFTHMCQMNRGTEILFQSQTEPKAAELVDYAKCLVHRQDSDIQKQHPLVAPSSKQSWLELAWKNDSRIVGIPHGADKIRSYHPTALFMDEAAFIPDAEASFNEALAVCQKIALVSSAGPGFFEEVCVSAE